MDDTKANIDPRNTCRDGCSSGFDDQKRLEVAKQFQLARIEFIRKVWDKDRDLKAEGFYLDDLDIQNALNGFEKKIPNLNKVGDLLLAEAATTKQLYKISATRTGSKDFSRNPEQGDLANDFLNHGNYLAYGSCYHFVGFGDSTWFCGDAW